MAALEAGVVAKAETEQEEASVEVVMGLAMEAREANALGQRDGLDSSVAPRSTGVGSAARMAPGLPEETSAG